MTDHNEFRDAESYFINHVKNALCDAASYMIKKGTDKVCEVSSDLIKKGTDKVCDAGSSFIKNVTNKQTNENDFNNNQIRFIKMSNGLVCWGFSFFLHL